MSSRLLWILAALATFAALAIALRLRFVSGLGWLVLGTTVAGLALWLLVRSGRRLLWRVGRRLLVSHLLIGVLPIPILLGIAMVGGYIAAGFFLSHVSRTAVESLGAQVRVAAEAALPSAASQTTSPRPTDGIATALYRDGAKISGDPRAPERFPAWLAEGLGPDLDGEPVLVSLADGTRTVAAAIERAGTGAVAFADDDLEEAVRASTRIWVELFGANDGGIGGTTVNIFNNRWVLTPLRRTRTGQEILSHFERQGLATGILVRGIDNLGATYPLTEELGESDDLSATLFAPGGVILDELFSGSAEIDTLAWLVFILPAFLLMDIYALAAIMAATVVLRVSRAVNELSTATNSVQEGDFSTRIPVKRDDQIGALQTTFNQMTANLEELVDQAAAQEILHKELQIAHDLQRSLLPSELSQLESVEVATFFEPSAAIGGDYFDVFALDGGSRLAVVVADVAGHGISAGLHMAMFKAALDTLVYEGKSPDLILETLDGLVRTTRAERRLITATLALFEPASGSLQLTNAGHPPTYHLHNGSVREIALPSPPLGALASTYGRSNLSIDSGDVLVWLSDGFIEACDAGAESFGYERVIAALAGDTTSSVVVRDRLLSAVKHHTGAEEISDDRTVVVLRYQPTQ